MEHKQTESKCDTCVMFFFCLSLAWNLYVKSVRYGIFLFRSVGALFENLILRPLKVLPCASVCVCHWRFVCPSCVSLLRLACGCQVKRSFAVCVQIHACCSRHRNPFHARPPRSSPLDSLHWLVAALPLFSRYNLLILSIPNGQPMPASVRLPVLPSSGSVSAPRRKFHSFASLAATPKISFGLVLSVNKLLL